MLYVDLFESEAIAKFCYDRAALLLVIFFKRGGVYEYRDVPAPIFEAFRAAPSKGQYFQAHVRGQFTPRALTPQQVAGLALAPGATQARDVWIEMVRLDRADAMPVFF